MLHVLIASLIAPPSCPCDVTDWRCRAEHPVCKEQSASTTKGPEKASARVEQKPRPAVDPETTALGKKEPKSDNSFLADGGYAFVNPVGAARQSAERSSFMWGLEAGGWIPMHGASALGFGLRFEHELNYSPFLRFAVPLRIAVGGHRVVGYSVFSPALASTDLCTTDEYLDIHCSKELGADLEFGMGILVMLWKGITIGAEPGFHRSYWNTAGGSTELSSFGFRTWIGWKFGRA